MTSISELIAAARDEGDKRRKSFSPPRDLAKLIRSLADALEAEHQRAEAYRIMQRETAKAARGIVAERDALRTAIQELHAGLGRFDPVAFHAEATEILSRAIDTKEKP